MCRGEPSPSERIHQFRGESPEIRAETQKPPGAGRHSSTPSIGSEAGRHPPRRGPTTPTGCRSTARSSSESTGCWMTRCETPRPGSESRKRSNTASRAPGRVGSPRSTGSSIRSWGRTLWSCRRATTIRTESRTSPRRHAEPLRRESWNQRGVDQVVPTSRLAGHVPTRGAVS